MNEIIFDHQQKHSTNQINFEYLVKRSTEKRLIRGTIFKSVFIILVPGLILFVLSIAKPFPFLKISWVFNLFNSFGSVLLAIGSINVLYDISVHFRLNQKLKSLSDVIIDLQNTVSIASGAIESGLTAVYAKRQDAMTEIQDLLEIIIANKDFILRESNTSNIEIKLLGISLGDYLCPHGALKDTLKKLLNEDKIKIKMMILKDGCQAAIERALKEEPHKFLDSKSEKDIQNAYKDTKCHDELKTATDEAEDITRRKQLQSKNDLAVFAPNELPVNAEFEFITYDYAPMAFILILNEIMFVENYHLAGRGGESPILKIAKHREGSAKPTKLFNIYENHFNVLEKLSLNADDTLSKHRKLLQEVKEAESKISSRNNENG